MAEFLAVSNERHAGKRWRKNTNFAFAAADTVAVLGTGEVSKAMMVSAIAFVAAEGGYDAVSLQGLHNGSNLFVAPDGRWESPYIPAIYRIHPFRLAQRDDGDQFLCLDENSIDFCDGSDGDLFFDSEGKPTPSVMEMFNLLLQTARDREHMRKACNKLSERGLLEEWPLTVQGDSETLTITGLYRINESRLNETDGDTLLELRQCGALMIAYGQLFSTQNIHKYSPLLARQRQALKKIALGKRQVGILEDNGTLNFDNLR